MQERNQSRVSLLSELLAHAIDTYTTRPFLIGVQEQTYQEFGQSLVEACKYLKDIGIKSGDNIVIVGKNSAEIVLVAMAAGSIGSTFTILNSHSTLRTIRAVVNQCTPAVVFYDEVVADLENAIACTKLVNIRRCGLYKREWRKNHSKDVFRLEYPGGCSQDPVCLIFTSGSTGKPKGVIVTHENIVFTTRAIQERLRYETGDRVGVFLPLSFDYALYQIFLAIQVGAAVILSDIDFVPAMVAEIEKREISVLPVVPSLLAQLLLLAQRRNFRLSAIRCITSTGDHMPANHIDKFRENWPHISLFSMYGLTECKRVSILLPEELEQRPQSVGRSLPGTEVFVVDKSGKRLPSGCKGEIVVRGRNVTLGYWRDEIETGKRFRSCGKHLRELRTGDLGSLDDDGFVYVQGRLDSIIKHKGYRISSIEVESVTNEIVGVVESCLVQNDSEGSLHLFVVSADGVVTEKTILRELKTQIEVYKLPKRIRIVRQLPKTPNGKVDRELLKIATSSPSYSL